jgi:hypothetical protein
MPGWLLWLSHSDLHGGGEERLRPTAGAGRLTQPRHRYGRGGHGALMPLTEQGTPEEGLDLLEKIPCCYYKSCRGQPY